MMIEVSRHSLPDRALIYAVQAHGDQKRKYTNDPYIVHPISVAGRLRRALLIDGIPPHIVDKAVAAAYLHDVVEDGWVSPPDLFEEFPEDVVNLVLEVTDVSTKLDGNRVMRKTIDREHMMGCSAMAASIKLADMIDNSISITQFDPGFSVVYMKEKELLLPYLSHGNRWLLREAHDIVRNYCNSTTAKG